MIWSALHPMVWLAFVAGASTDSIPPRLTSLSAAETALVAAVEKKGMRDAFDTRMSPLATLFQPYPTRGQTWIKEHAMPDARWTPAFVEVSGVGDLGYSVGPWHTTGADSLPVISGQYLSFWRYHPQTDWKMMLHITAGAHLQTKPAPPPAGEFAWIMGPVPVVASHDTVTARRNTLGAADAALAASVNQQGWRAGYAAVTAPDARGYRPGEPPAVGQAALLERLAKESGTVEWDVVGSWLAQSIDLGYTYGRCLRGAGAAGEPAQEWAYVHVWRMDRKGSRRLALEFLAPIVRQ